MLRELHIYWVLNQYVRFEDLDLYVTTWVSNKIIIDAIDYFDLDHIK